AVTSHDGRSLLARLAVAGVLAAEAAVLAQRHPVRVVALALVRLVVAMLAILAGEGDSDSHVSAGHGSEIPGSSVVLPRAKKNPARGARSTPKSSVPDRPRPRRNAPP